ncbi:hypothetical protein FW789_14750 [Pseudomonas sp. 1121_17]
MGAVAGNTYFGAALQPFRDTRPLLQEQIAASCRSGLVSRKGRAAAPVTADQANSSATSSRTIAFSASIRLMYFQSDSSM